MYLTNLKYNLYLLLSIARNFVATDHRKKNVRRLKFTKYYMDPTYQKICCNFERFQSKKG